MTAATITFASSEALAEDVVQLTVTDGETYVTKLSSIVGVVATQNEDNDYDLNCSWSGRTITINLAGATDKLVTLIVKGRL